MAKEKDKHECERNQGKSILHFVSEWPAELSNRNLGNLQISSSGTGRDGDAFIKKGKHDKEN